LYLPAESSDQVLRQVRPSEQGTPEIQACPQLSSQATDPYFRNALSLGPYIPRKAVPGFLLCIFSSLACLKKHVFSKGDLMRWKVPARLYWDLLTSGT